MPTDPRVEPNEILLAIEAMRVEQKAAHTLLVTRLDEKLDTQSATLRSEIKDVVTRVGQVEEAGRKRGDEYRRDQEKTREAVHDFGTKLTEVRTDVDQLMQAREQSMRAPVPKTTSGFTAAVRDVAAATAATTKSSADIALEAAVGVAVSELAEVKKTIARLDGETRLQTEVLKRLDGFSRHPLVRAAAQTIALAFVTYSAAQSAHLSALATAQQQQIAMTTQQRGIETFERSVKDAGTQ